MKIFVSLFCAVLIVLSAPAFSASYFIDKPVIAQRASPLPTSTAKRVADLAQARYLSADVPSLQALLTVDEVELELPLPDGSTARYRLTYSPIAAPALLEKFPQLRTFRGVDIFNPDNTGRFDISPSGFRGMFHHNGERVFIDPEFITESANAVEDHVAYLARNARPLSTRAADKILRTAALSTGKRGQRSSKASARGSSDGNFRTYRLAVAVTGEFTDFFAGSPTAALSAVMTTINRVNDVYENDLSIRLELVGRNDDLIYTDSSSDPYNNVNDAAELSRNRVNINTVIGVANYDIGHLFTSSNGGLAQIGATCVDSVKGEGLTGSANPTGDPFYIDFVAHEIGHQFGADHTFNGTAVNCGSSGARIAENAYEPGSGSTIMGYAGICGVQDLQSNTDPYFHAASILEISEYVSDPNTGGSCGTTTTPVNAVPEADAGSDLTIPANTPFFLTGSATDDDTDDELTYVWEQYDAGDQAGDATATVAEMDDNGSRPLFRSELPSTSPTRFFPRLSDVVSGGTTLGETYPTTTRPLNFRFTVRDNSPGNGATAYDDRLINVTTTSGPFSVILPSGAELWNAATDLVTWNVNNTDQAPVSCAEVDVLLSVDNGANFEALLLAGTPNDGSEAVTVPSLNNSQARIMVRCRNHIFYAVNDAVFSITASGAAVNAIADATVVEGGSINFTVNLSTPTISTITTTFKIVEGTASTADYSAPVFGSSVSESNGLLTIPSGVSSFSVSIPTVQDDELEADETLTLEIGGITATGTIEDNDEVVVSSISNADAIEGQTLYFQVILSAATLVDTDFDYEISNVTTVAADYTNTLFSDGVTETGGITLTVPAGVSRFTVSIDAATDTITESNETFTLTIDGVSATGTIGLVEDDDDTETPSTGTDPGSFDDGGGVGHMGPWVTLLLLLLMVYRYSGLSHAPNILRLKSNGE